MLEIPRLETITDRKKSESDITFQTMVDERRLLRTKLKVLQIEAVERDLARLKEENLSPTHLKLSDFCLTPNYNLYLPIKDKIVKPKGNTSIPLDSYFIYLSYLYNVDFRKYYWENRDTFYQILDAINIPEDIKRNFILALKLKKAESFSAYSAYLHSSEFREQLKNDEQELGRIIKM